MVREQPFPGPSEGKTDHGLEHHHIHLAAGDFDAPSGIENGSVPEPSDGADADQQRPRAGEPDPDLGAREGARVGPAGGEVPGGSLDQLVIERAEPGLAGRVEEVGRPQTEPGEAVGGEIAAAQAEIPRKVTENVDELKSLAKTDAAFAQCGKIERCFGKQVRAAHLGPEKAHASGNAEGVVVQLGNGREGDDGRGAVRNGRGPFGVEPAQVEFLAAGDGREDFADAPPVFGRKRGENREGVFDPFEQDPFARGGGAVFLTPRKPAQVQRVGPLPLDAAAQMIEHGEALGGRHEPGVGQGVGGAGEQIGEADGRAHRTRQHAQGQVKRPRNVAQEAGEEFVRICHERRRPVIRRGPPGFNVFSGELPRQNRIDTPSRFRLPNPGPDEGSGGNLKTVTMVRYFLRGIALPIAYDLHSGLNTLGRNPTNDLRIHEASVSSFHCEVTVNDDGTVAVRDLQSTNGTFIDDQPVDEAPLQVGQVLQLGVVTLRLELEQVEIHVPVPPLAAEPPKVATTLPDGRLACYRKPELAATHRCTQCNLPFYISSLRGMRLSGGASVLLFCPECDGKCEAIPGVGDRKTKQSLIGRLTQTIMLGWKKK